MKMRATVILWIGTIIFFVSLSACDDSPRDPNTARIMDLMNTIGATATIQARADRTPCFDAISSLNDALDATAKSDDIGFNQIADAHAIVLESGSKVRLIENSAGSIGGALRFRIESGTNYGKACWVPGAMTGLVKNIQGE